MILVEDPNGFLNPPKAREDLLRELATQFRVHDVNTQVIEQARVDKLQARSADFDRMSVSRIGAAVGAEQVLYVFVVRFGLPLPGSAEQVYEVNVRVVNAKPSNLKDRKDVSLWPGTPGRGQRIEIRRPASTSAQPTDAVEVSRAMAIALADHIARCFYDVPTTPSSPASRQAYPSP